MIFKIKKMKRILRESAFIEDGLYMQKLGDFIECEYQLRYVVYKYNGIRLARLIIDGVYHLTIYVTNRDEAFSLEAHRRMLLFNEAHIEAIREFISLYRIPDYGFTISYNMIIRDYIYWTDVLSFKPFNLEVNNVLNIPVESTLGDIYTLHPGNTIQVNDKIITKANNKSHVVLDLIDKGSQPKTDFIITHDVILFKVGSEYRSQPFDNGDIAYTLIKLMIKPIMVKSARNSSR